MTRSWERGVETRLLSLVFKSFLVSTLSIIINCQLLKVISLSIKSSMELTGSSNAVLIIMSKIKAPANQVRNIPQITQNLNTDIMLIVVIFGVIVIVSSTSVSCLSHVRIVKLFWLIFILAGKHFCGPTHWNHHTRQIKN